MTLEFGTVVQSLFRLVRYQCTKQTVEILAGAMYQEFLRSTTLGAKSLKHFPLDVRREGLSQ